MCEPGTCEDCCSTDEWIVPASLRAKGPASTEGGPVHQPQMGRDGGESDV